MAGSTINIPEDLMARLEQAAATENLSPDKLVQAAVEEHLRKNSASVFTIERSSGSPVNEACAPNLGN